MNGPEQRAPPSPWIDELEARSNLTRSQYLIWSAQRLNAGSPLYNMAFAFYINGRLDGDRFASAWESATGGIESLRTVIRVSDGVPMQQALPESPPLARLDLRSSGSPEADAQQWIREHSGHLFDLSAATTESALLRIGDSSWIWYLNQHHVVTDAMSVALIFHAVQDAYLGGERTGKANAGFGDYVAREHELRLTTRHAALRQAWREACAEPLEPLSPFDRDRRGRGGRTERVRRRLSRETTGRLRALAGEPAFRGISPDLGLANVLYALVGAWAGRIAGGREFCIGMPLHHRARPADRRTPGLFMEVLPLRLRFDPAMSFKALGEHARAGILRTLGKGQPGLSTPELNRRYGVLLNVLPMQMGSFAGLDTRCDWVHSGAGDSAHWLRIQAHDFDGSGCLTLDFDFDAQLFPEAYRNLAADQFERLIAGVLADPDRPLGTLDLASEGERHARTVAFNDTQRAFPPGTVIDRFLRQAKGQPEAVAVRCGDQQLSYGELEARSRALAARLSADGVGPGSLVPVCLDRGLDLIVALLAVQRAGAAYVPLDPAHPALRRLAILEDIGRHTRGPRLLLTGADHESAAGADRNSEAALGPGFSSWRVLPVPDAAAGGRPAGKVAGGPDADDLAYVIYTSGSTGMPKGTLISHAALGNYVDWAIDAYGAGPGVAFALHSSPAVDLTVTSIFVPLASGGEIVAYPESGADTLPILRAFEDDRADVLKLTPAHLALIGELTGQSRRTRTLILGGEDLKTELVKACLPRFSGDCRLFNEYGPTEATVGCMIHEYGPGDAGLGSVPIGRPIANARIHLLDASGQPVPTGVTGEICIAGAGVALGYLGRDDLTASAFVAEPSPTGGRMYRTGDRGRWALDGRLEFLGRDDDQIKIRGSRVEAGEVEAALLAHPLVREAKVAAVAGAGALRHCVRCGIASNYPDIVFDEHDVCSMCLAFDMFEEHARRYFGTMTDFEAVAEKMVATGHPRYDCLALVSGGKDSSYMLHELVARGLRVLAVTLDNGYLSDEALENVRRVCAILGVDSEILTTPHMDAIFADSLRRHSNVCHGCFKTIYTLALQRAREEGLRYIVTGLSRGQIFETRLHDLFALRIFDPAEIERRIIAARKVYHRVDDAVKHLLDTNIFNDDSVFTDIEFVDFYRYCDVDLDEIYRTLQSRLPWIRPGDTGRSTNCRINDVGIFVHQRERGFHNYALPYSWDVRIGHKRREAAMAELDDEIDRERVTAILRDIGYPEPGLDARGDRLAAWYVSDPGLSPDTLKVFLAERLPAEMLPSHLIAVDHMPLTPAGKVDTGALPDWRAGAVSGDRIEAPANELESQLAHLWEELLDIREPGRNQSFFDLGGASLTAIQLGARIQAMFGVEVPLNSLFDAPTIADLAVIVEDLVLRDIEELPEGEAEALARDLG